MKARKWFIKRIVYEIGLKREDFHKKDETEESGYKERQCREMCSESQG